MANPLQRTTQFFMKTSQTQVQKEKDDHLTFWEKELIEDEQRKQRIIEAETTAESDATESEGVLVKDEDHIQDRKLLSPQLTSQTPAEHIISTSTSPSIETDPIMYLPGGRRSGGLPATKLDIDKNDEDYESDSEPMSSCQELVGRFCIFSQVTKFPYKYMQDPENRVSRRFFSSEKIYERNWDMHYLFGTEAYSSKPLMLVPLDQVRKLIEEIGQEFHVNVRVPDYPFQIAFHKDGTPTPTCIGLVNSKADMTDVQSKIPAPPGNFGSLPANPTDSQVRDYDAWADKMERALEAEKKKKGGKGKRRERRRWLVKENLTSLHRAQRYLGLRKKPSNAKLAISNASLKSHQPESTQLDDSSAKFLDYTQLAPFPFEDDTVIISVDVESWETDHSVITEIGISTLDTTDIKAIAPGPRGEEWIKKIRSRHLRIKGRESFANFKFCESNPDMFQFGTSEFVTLEEAPEIVDSCFEYPYSAGFECEGPPPTDDKGNQIPRTSATQDVDRAPTPNTPRTLLIVGHDLSGDMEYLSSLGSEIFGTKPTSTPTDGPSRRQRVLSSIREYLDTAVFYKTLKKDEQPRSLAKVCVDLDIEAWYPHNAGNDARYTLEAFVKMVIKSRQQDDGVTIITQEMDELKVEKEQPVEVAVEASKPAAREERFDNYHAGEIDGTDYEESTQFEPFFRPDIGVINAHIESDVDSGDDLDEDPY